MTIDLPEDLKRYVQSQVQCGRFASADEAIAEAVRLLRQRSQQPEVAVKPLTEQEWENRLVDAGLLASPPPRGEGACPRHAFQPIPIDGEPLSQTVIRERR